MPDPALSPVYAFLSNQKYKSEGLGMTFVGSTLTIEGLELSRPYILSWYGYTGSTSNRPGIYSHPGGSTITIISSPASHQGFAYESIVIEPVANTDVLKFQNFSNTDEYCFSAYQA